MKKSIVLFALCLFAFANIQTAQAQTKEETIAWIKEKLQKTPADGRSPDGRSLEIVEIGNISITPCRVSYYYIVKDIYDRKYANAYYLHEVSFPTNSIVSTGEDYFGLGAVSIGFDAKAVEEKIYTKYGRLT